MERDFKKLAFQAYALLKIVFVVSPIVSGLDKFFVYLVDWDQYLGLDFGGYSNGFIMAIGAMEILFGIGVIFKSQIFGYIVACWLAFTSLNLLFLGDFYDVMFRDLGLCLSAFAFARLARAFA